MSRERCDRKCCVIDANRFYTDGTKYCSFHDPKTRNKIKQNWRKEE